MNDLQADGELWKAVPDFPDYAVSSLGRVKRVTIDARGHKPRILATGLNNKGYVIVSLTRGGVARKVLVSRLVCHAFNGPPPSSALDAAHGDGIPLHNFPSNLRWATRASNMADCLAHGTRATGPKHGRSTKPERTPRGQRHGHAKLSDEEVLAIRAAPQNPGSGRALAALYKVSPATISLIRSGKTWNHDLKGKGNG